MGSNCSKGRGPLFSHLGTPRAGGRLGPDLVSAGMRAGPVQFAPVVAATLIHTLDEVFPGSVNLTLY